MKLWSQGMKRCENGERRMEDREYVLFKFSEFLKRECEDIFLKKWNFHRVNVEFGTLPIIHLDVFEKNGDSYRIIVNYRWDMTFYDCIFKTLCEMEKRIKNYFPGEDWFAQALGDLKNNLWTYYKHYNHGSLE